MALKSLFLLNKASFLIRSSTRFPLTLSTRYLSSTMTEVLRDFDKAKDRLNSVTDNLSNDDKLKLYSLFKQATVGPCNIKKPSSFDFVGKAKYSAWNELGNLSKEDAMKKYISFVNDLNPSSISSSTSDKSNLQKSMYEGITYSVENKITRITLSRPEKKNAITVQMYKDISSALKEAGENDTLFTVLTGEGDYFSSGNDLNNFLSFQGDPAEAAKGGGEVLKSFVSSFIDFPKPLIAAVNGPAVGISVTCLGLCDVVYASDKATFNTPFSMLGQTPEGCATYTFPSIMGYSMANEVLLFNKKLTAQEAHKYRLVAEIFPHDNFKEHLEKRLSTMTDGSRFSMLYSKQLIRDINKDLLHKVNTAECARLVERWQSPDCIEAIANFFQRKAKL